MPWVDLYSENDYASIFYTTNTFCYNVSAFDPEKPTIVILHPVFLDSTWLDLQMSDPRFNKAYNLIAFDMRSSGQSVCRPSAQHDSWVDAADLAFCFQKLHLPASHILSLEGTSICCALRFAVLFPEFCLSLTLVNVPAPTELKWVYKSIDELVYAACFADDLESFERTAFECIEFLFGPDSDPDLIDDLVSYWETKLPPSKRVRVAETTSVYLSRKPLNQEMLASIQKPVLIVQGEKNQLCPMKYAERLSRQLTSVPEETILYDVKGGKSMLSVVPGPASILNNVFYKFLARLSHHRSDLVPPDQTIEERMGTALKTLSHYSKNNEITNLDPLSSLSFCCLTPEEIKNQDSILRNYSKNVDQAFDPSSGEGTLRKYSEREHEEWSYSERASLSLNGPANAPPSERAKQDFIPLAKITTRSDSYSTLSVAESTSPLLKTTFSTASATAGEKRHGKNPTANSQQIGKVVVTTTTTTPALAHRPLA